MGVDDFHPVEVPGSAEQTGRRKKGKGDLVFINLFSF